jgi:hypothetical protein
LRDAGCVGGMASATRSGAAARDAPGASPPWRQCAAGDNGGADQHDAFRHNERCAAILVSSDMLLAGSSSSLVALKELCHLCCTLEQLPRAQRAAQSPCPSAPHAAPRQRARGEACSMSAALSTRRRPCPPARSRTGAAAFPW